MQSSVLWEVERWTIVDVLIVYRFDSVHDVPVQGYFRVIGNAYLSGPKGNYDGRNITRGSDEHFH